MRNMNTPWGRADYVHFHAPDRSIIRVGTSSHGGIGVASARDMPDHLASIGFVEGEWRWFEEDQDYCAAVVAFPEHFPPEWQESAKLTLQNWYPEAHMRHFGSVLTGATSLALEKREWESATRDKWVALSGFGDWSWNTPAGKVYACGFRARDGATAGFLVPAEEYDVNPARLVLDGYPRWEPDRTLPYTKPRNTRVGEVA